MRLVSCGGRRIGPAAAQGVGNSEKCAVLLVLRVTGA
jgi:hypothetical protein